MFLYVSLHKCKDVCASALPCRDCEGKVILSPKNHHQDRSVTENSPNDRVKWYYDKKSLISTPSDLKINADMKQETTRTGRKASIADTLLTKADPLT